MTDATDAYTTGDPNNPFAAIKGFFGGGGLDANDPNANQALRQRIAMAMMARQRPFPKTIGEGLSAIGNAIGDTNMARMLEQQDATARATPYPGSVPAAAAAATSSAPPALPSVITRGPQASTGGAATAASLEPQDQSQFNAVDAGQPTPHPIVDMIAKLESNRGADNASQPPSMVNPTYGQYGAFAKDYGNGPEGIHSFAQKVLAARPDATVGDMYSGYVLGTGQPGRYSMADLKTTTVPGARGAYGNLVNNSPLDPATPLSKFYGGDAQTASSDTQDATLREVTGVGGQPTRAAAYAPTASLDPRDGIARALVNRNMPAPGVPPVNPIIPGAVPPVPSTLTPSTGGLTPADQQVAENIVSPAQSPTVMSDVRPAPIVPQQQPQQQQTRPDYVMPEPRPPAPPQPVMPTPEYMQAFRVKNSSGNPYWQAQADQIMAVEQAKMAFEQQNREKTYQSALDVYKADHATWQQQVATQAQRGQTYRKEEQAIIGGAPPAAGTSPGRQDPRLGTPQSPQRTGVPVAPPVPPGTTPQEHATAYAPLLTSAVEAERTAEPQFQRSLDLLDELRNHPGREYGLGGYGKIYGNIPGTEAYAFQRLVDQAKGKLFLQAYSTLKGGGQISNIEGEKATQALARLDPNLSKDEFDKALNDLALTLRSDMELAQRKVNKPVTAWRGPDQKTFAPDIGQRRGSNVYVGGDPANPRSWEPAQ